jgi:hypothetical protein
MPFAVAVCAPCPCADGERVNDAAILRHALIARPDSDLLETGDCLLSHRVAPWQARERYTADLRDHAILPALVNAHDHLHLNGIPPLPTG